MTVRQGPAPEIVHLVPGEICIVIEAERVEDGPGWYAAVRDELNRQVRTLLINPPPWDDFGKAVRQDLATPKLIAAFSGGADVLQSLGRDDDFATAWVPLPGLNAPASLLFYQIGTAEDNARAAAADRREWVRELANLVNVRLRLPLASSGGEPGRIVAATPNWLAAGTQGEMTGGGPGSLPKRAPAGRWDMSFPEPGLAAKVAAARERGETSGVAVAVLDTCPDPAVVRAKAKALGPRHALHRMILGSRRRDGPAIALDGPVGSRFRRLGHCVVNWNQVPTDEPDYEQHFQMADHGLFVAGVIKNIAPWAEISITRVLNDWGVGDVHALTTALAGLAKAMRDDDGRRLIVNLSLMVDQPPHDELFQLYWPSAAAEAPDVLSAADMAVIGLTLSLADAALARALGALPPKRALIVAAAGNDATPGTSRPEPRLPARYDSAGAMPNIMGVAAMTADRQPSNFSNEADIVPDPRGIAAFGGNAARQTSGPSLIVLDSAGHEDAVVGVFSARTLPITDDPNTSGWVYWAGTSFATPIISGIAADLWQPGEDAQVVAAAVQGYATDAEPPLLSGGIRAYQRQ